MSLGMVLIGVGLAASVYGLCIHLPEASRSGIARVRVRALDDAPLNRGHLGLLLALSIAVMIDAMKPVTLGFVMPGMALEYGLNSPLNPTRTAPPVALLALSGITGTVIGSLLWGGLGDRIGRRASILLAGIVFIATSICGAMPNYAWNLLMCAVMGLGAGGMLPITFALMAEVIPARHRGWLMVMAGGDVAGAYVITSWLAAALTPSFGWRILWLLGLPTGMLLILLNRWIPESPRFLVATGRGADARAVLERYGATVLDVAASELTLDNEVEGRWGELFKLPFSRLTTVVAVFGLGVGLATYGFQLWIPSNLQALGLTEDASDRILRDSALIGLPATFLVAGLYGFWSSKKTLILLALLMAGSFLGLAIVGHELVNHSLLLYVFLITPLAGTSSAVAVLIAYSSEVYPTRIRARGTGLAAGACKLGGVLITALVAAAVAPPSITGTSVTGGTAMILIALAVAAYGIETRRYALEEITAKEFDGGRPDA